jgi:polysaccharide biosynthesis protein PslH
MKILFLTSRFPYPPVRGDKIRVFNLIRELSKNHEIVLATFAEPDDGRYYTSLLKYVRRIERVSFKKTKAYLNAGLGLFSKKPLQVSYYSSPEMRQAVAKLVEEEQPDIIHAHLIRMAPYAAPYPEVPKVLDICDSMTLNYERFLMYRRDLTSLLYRLEKGRTKRYEGLIPLEFDVSLVISPHDRDFILGLCPDAELEIVPMGVDFTFFKPVSTKRLDNTMAFMGTMDYFPNVDAMKWFYQDVVPIIRRTIPKVELKIVGSSPAPEIEKLDSDPHVTVTGFVDDLRPIVGQATVFICPIRAATGINSKVIEAMAMGLPVVVTPEACEGIDVEDGINALVASDPMTFSEKVIEVLQNPETRDRIGQAGLEFVKTRFSWPTAVKTLEEVYKDIV